MHAIKTENLSKHFNGLKAVDGVSLEIEEGELFGLLGPNGAGKTTLIKMLSTLTRPTNGDSTVGGKSILKDKDGVRSNIGIVFQDFSLDTELTGRENLDFHGRLYCMESKLRQKRVKEILKLVELEEKADVLVKKYSGGMQRRLEIGRGLMHHPKVLFLDEPTLGLDAQTRRKIWEYIKKLNKEEDVTIILTSHYMEEADYLCQRVAIIDRGKIVALDSPENLKRNLGGDVITLDVGPRAKEIMEEISKEQWVEKTTSHDRKVHITLEKGEKMIPRIVSMAEKAGIELASVSIRKPTLEDVFLHFVGTTMEKREEDEKQIRKGLMHRRVLIRRKK